MYYVVRGVPSFSQYEKLFELKSARVRSKKYRFRPRAFVSPNATKKGTLFFQMSTIAREKEKATQQGRFGSRFFCSFWC